MFLRINQRTPFKQKLIQTMIQPTWNKKGFGMTSLRSLETTWNNIFNNHSGYISGVFFSLLIRSNILGEIATNLRTRTVSGACPSCRNPLKNMGKMWGNLPRNPRIKSESYGDLQKFTYLDFLVNKCKQDQLLETTSQTKKACPFIPLSKLGESITRPLQKCGSGSNCWFWRLKKQMSSCVKEMHRSAKRLFCWVMLTSDADFLLLPVWLWSFDMVFPVWLPLLLQNRFIAWHQAKIRTL